MESRNGFLSIALDLDTQKRNLLRYSNSVFKLSSNDGLYESLGSQVASGDIAKRFLQIARNFIRNYLSNVNIVEFEDSYRALGLGEVDKQCSSNILRGSKIFSFLGDKYNYIFSRYYSILPKNIQQLFIKFVNLWPSYISEKDFIKMLKDLGTQYTELRLNQNHPIWYDYFEELHVLSGYETELHTKTDIFYECEPFITERNCPTEYVDIFKYYIRETINKISIKSTNSVFDDWVKFRDNWQIMGSCDFGTAMKIQTSGFKQPTRINSKFTNLCEYTDQELLDLLYQKRPHLIRPFLKSNEPAKIRIVIAYDTRSYIRCSWLYDFIENLNGTENWTSVGFTPSDMWKVRDEIQNVIEAKNHNEKMVCTDQSAFDQHVYKEMFIYGFNYLCKRIEAKNPQIKKIVELENYGLSNAYFLFEDRGKYEWKNGLCSGHKFTALLGSIINRASTYTANWIAKKEAGYTWKSINRGFFQGDDAILFVPKTFNVQAFINGYTKLGLVVNPMKTWVNTTRTEYLHQSYYNNCVVNLPARGALSLIFNDPQSRVLGIDERLSNYLSNLAQSSRRGLNVKDVALRLLKRCNIDTRARCYCYLHTPTMYGGAGFLPYVPRERMLALKVRKVQSVQLKSEILTPVRYKIDGINVSDYILKRLSDHLPAPGIETKLSFSSVIFQDSIFDFRIGDNIEKRETGYDPMLVDNHDNWIAHVMDQLGLISPYENISYKRYASLRRIFDMKCNLISSRNNAFLPSEYLRPFKNDCYTIFKSCLNNYVSSTSAKAKINSLKRLYHNQFVQSTLKQARYLFAF